MALRPGPRLKLLSTSLFILVLDHCECSAPISVAILEKGSGKLLFFIFSLNVTHPYTTNSFKRDETSEAVVLKSVLEGEGRNVVANP